MKRILMVGERNPGTTGFVSGIMGYARERCLNWVLRATIPEKRIPRAHLEAARDGIILPPFPVEAEAYGRWAAQNAIPAVRVGYREDSSYDVEFDEEAIGRTAAKYLMDHGHHSFGYVAALARPPLRRRCEGFRDYLAECGRKAFVFGENASYSIWLERESAENVLSLRRWLKGLPRPVAIAAATDWSAYGVSDACLQEGLRIPEDVSILGVGDETIAVLLSHVALTSVETSREALGAEVARILHCRMRNRDPGPLPVRVPCGRVITRASTDLIATRDPVLRKSLEYIASHIDVPFTVDDMVRHVHSSRTLIQNRFREALGRTPLQEIHRQKIEKACRLLHETGLPITLIAEQCGYGDAMRFATTFRKHLGMSPTQYRKQHPLTQSG
jgi:LacI family transcriptional regulator